MALLNWGNALSQAGKGMATVGLEGVKATMEQDKIRLAADLAAKEGILSDTRRAEAALDLAGKQGEIAAEAARTLADVNTASAQELKDRSLAEIAARNKGPEALAALMNAQSNKALNDFTLTNARELKVLQTNLKNITGTDAAAESRRLDIKAQISAQSATAATIAADRTGAIALLSTTGIELSRATEKRNMAAATLAFDPTNPDARAALDSAIETERYAFSNYQGSVENAKRNVAGFQPSPISTLGTGTGTGTGTPAPAPAPAPGAGAGTAKPAALPLFKGQPVTEAPGVLTRIGTSVTNALAAQGRRETDMAEAAARPYYKAAADEINAAFNNKREVRIPGGVPRLKSVMNFDPKLLDPVVRDYAARLPKPGSSSALTPNTDDDPIGLRNGR